MGTVSYNDEDDNVCFWSDLFSNDERASLQQGFLITGLLSILFSSCLSMTLLFTNLGNDKSYRNLANFTVVACIRRVVSMFLYLPHIKTIVFSCEFETLSCEFFAFFETFLAVLEVECLTHVCIERYVVAKYISNGWPVKKEHYSLYIYLCLFFSCLYSFPPLFGFGQYGYDFQCTSCTFDMMLPETWQRYLVITIFILRSVKPTIFMTLMLIWARVLENKFLCPEKSQHLHFTRSIIVITVVNLVCWTPIALIRGSVVFSNLLYMNVVLPSTASITWAMWIHWAAPAFTAVAMFLVDGCLRKKMFKLGSTEDDENIDNKKD